MLWDSISIESKRMLVSIVGNVLMQDNTKKK